MSLRRALEAIRSGARTALTDFLSFFLLGFAVIATAAGAGFLFRVFRWAAGL